MLFLNTLNPEEIKLLRRYAKNLKIDIETLIYQITEEESLVQKGVAQRSSPAANIGLSSLNCNA